MKLCVLVVVVVVLIYCCWANVQNASATGGFYEYDTTRNGWYQHMNDPTSPIVVNMRQHRYHGVPDRYHDFVNRTLARQPTGVCHNEIPYVILINFYKK